MRRTLLVTLWALLCTRTGWSQAPENVPLPPTATPLPARQAGLSFLENLTSFDPTHVELRWLDNRWQIMAGTQTLKDFGKRESEARQALRLIRGLRLSQHGTIGSPRPVLEYWLRDGAAPQGRNPGVPLTTIDMNSLKVERIQGQWCVADAKQVHFMFGAHQEDAKRTAEVIRHYGFNRVGFVGQNTPGMICFLTEHKDNAFVVRADGRSAEQVEEARKQATALLSAKSANKHANLPALPLRTRQLSNPSDASGANVAGAGERVPFDWRRVQLRQDNKEWRLTCGGQTLASFGANERDAKLALDVVQRYSFTEQCQLGGSASPYSYFLVNGAAPRGVPFAVPHQPFRAESLTVQERHGRHVLVDGSRALLAFARPEQAQQALEVIRKHQFDHLCRIGRTEPPALTFFVRAR